MKRNARKEMSNQELEVYKDAISSSIKKDFLKNEVSYQDASTMQCLAGYKRSTIEAKKEVRQLLKKEFNASIVAVGNGKVAIVKRHGDDECF